MIDRFNKISSVLLLTIVAECMSKPLDSQTLSTLPSQMTKVHGNRMKRLPLELGYVASGLSPHNDEQHFSSDISSHDHIKKFTPSFPLQVQEAISTNAIKSETLHKGPFVSDGAVINLVGHEIHQIHDTSQHHEFPRQIIVPLNDHPVIIPHTITVIHGLTPPISKPKKASGVSHLFASENKFETHANVNSLDNESDFSEHFVPVIPVTSHIVLGHVAKPTSTQPQHGPVDLNEFGDQPIALPQRDEGNYRSMVGGYGVGLGSGGQGAGHGFYSSAFK